MPISEQGRKLLRLYANVLEHGEKTGGRVNVEVQQVGAKVPGFNKMLPTGQYIILLHYVPGSKGVENGVSLLDDCLSPDAFNPNKLEPYPDADAVLGLLTQDARASFGVSQEELVRKLFDPSPLTTTAVEDAAPQKSESSSLLLGVDP